MLFGMRGMFGFSHVMDVLQSAAHLCLSQVLHKLSSRAVTSCRFVIGVLLSCRQEDFRLLVTGGLLVSQKAFPIGVLLSCHRTGDGTGDVSCLSPVAPTPDKAKQGYNTALEKFYCSAMWHREGAVSDLPCEKET